MKGESVVYCGRLVPVEGFRTFVYDFSGKQKLVNSYLQYEEAIQSGLYFSKKDKIPAPVAEKLKKGRRKNVNGS